MLTVWGKSIRNWLDSSPFHQSSKEKNYPNVTSSINTHLKKTIPAGYAFYYAYTSSPRSTVLFDDDILGIEAQGLLYQDKRHILWIICDQQYISRRQIRKKLNEEDIIVGDKMSNFFDLELFDAELLEMQKEHELNETNAELIAGSVKIYADALLRKISAAGKKTYWSALESNPITMNKLIKDIGVKGLRCEDIYGFDDKYLNSFPQPCYAVILCSPDYKKATEYVKDSYDELKSKEYKNPENVFFMHQKIGNAGGIFSLLHAIANIRNQIDIGNGAFAEWLAKALPLGVHDRSLCLEKDEEMHKAHESSAGSGETGVPENDAVESHFITFFNVDATLFEFNSAMEFARPLGPRTPRTMLHDVAKYIRDFISKFESGSIAFNAIAVVGDE